MPGELIISVSGMRGIVGENLTEDVAISYGSSFGYFLKDRCDSKKKRLSVCIGSDSRVSGDMLKAAVAAGLCEIGIDVIDLGVVTTPGVGIMVGKLDCDGGVVITASHNPIEYNGIKLLLSNGIAPSAEDAKKIKKYYLDKTFESIAPTESGRVTQDETSDTAHIEKVLAIVDKELIAGKRFKIAVDSMNGAGCRVTAKLWSQLGCCVKGINDGATGIFAHTPEPIEANLGGLCDVVKAGDFDIGFAQDPDADRLVIVDEQGRYIGEEYSLALAAKYIFSKQKGFAATNLSTSRMIDDIAGAAGCEVIRTAVGEANVAGAMIEHDCVIGGEGNGGVIDLRVGPVRDSLVGMSLVLQLMAKTGKSISELAGEIRGYCMLKKKFEVDKVAAGNIIDKAREIFSEAKINTADGCRFDLADGWVHLRMSNTEPVMRLIAEAEDEQKAKEYVKIVSVIISEIS